MNTIEALQELYIGLGGDLTDIYEGIANGAPVSDYTVIPDMIAACAQIAEPGGGSGKLEESWHQCPEAVRNYMANVNYTDVPYTQSSISTYAPNPPEPATNTKPIGKTVDGVTYYNNVPGEETPFASENAAGTLEPLDQVRWIKSTTNNMRDIGGWECDGGTVKYGLLYRSGDLQASDENLIVNQLGIKTEIDLTTDGTPAYSGKMKFVCPDSSIMYSLSNTTAWKEILQAVFEAVSYGAPVIFHCSEGADRSATLACILEGLLGVSQSDCDKDYELTSFYTLRARDGSYQTDPNLTWAHLISDVLSKGGTTFRDDCVTFVASLGFTAADINAFRAAMIDGTPEPIVLPEYTDWIPLSTTEMGGTEIYNSTGYKDGYRYKSDMTEAENAGTFITGYIPVKAGDEVRFYGNIVSGTLGTLNSALYTTGGSKAYQFTPYSFSSNEAVADDYAPYDYDDTNHILASVTAKIDGYIKFTFVGTYVEGTTIVTINEEI